MYLFYFFIFIFTVYGLSNMIVYSNGPFNIFSGFRSLMNKVNPNLGELFSCMMCFPFWGGVMVSAIDMYLMKSTVISPFNIILMMEPSSLAINMIILLMDGMIASGCVWIIHNIEEYFEK